MKRFIRIYFTRTVHRETDILTEFNYSFLTKSKAKTLEGLWRIAKKHRYGPLDGNPIRFESLIVE